MKNNRISKKSRKFNKLGIVSANLLSGNYTKYGVWKTLFGGKQYSIMNKLLIIRLPEKKLEEALLEQKAFLVHLVRN